MILVLIRKKMKTIMKLNHIIVVHPVRSAQTKWNYFRRLGVIFNTLLSKETNFVTSVITSLEMTKKSAMGF